MDVTDFSLGSFSLTGRRAIVTGGNTGLGRALSLALARAGADVLVATATGDDGATRDLVERTGARYEEMAIDLTVPGSAATVVQGCLDALGGVDILVNNAGLNRTAAVTDFGRDRWDPMLAVNLTAAFEMIHEITRPMIDQGHGKIINVASLFSSLGGRRSPAYAASKHGIVGLTRACADELSGDGIQVNAIAPGYLVTPMTEAIRRDPEREAEIRARIPAGRWGQPADLMGAIVFLASPAADYVTGTVLGVDGGYLVR